MPGVNAGWANNCGIQLFTVGWVECPTPDVPPVGGGRSSGPSVGPGDFFNQAPSIKKKEPLYLQQAIQEDEELMIIIKAFVETIRWR